MSAFQFARKNLVDYRKVQKVKCNLGHSHRSQAEASLCLNIQAREQSGECRLIQAECHVYMTKARLLYIPDFKIFDLKLNQEVWEEMKGFETSQWKRNQRLWKHYGPGLLRVWKKGKRDIFLFKEIWPEETASEHE